MSLNLCTKLVVQYHSLTSIFFSSILSTISSPSSSKTSTESISSFDKRSRWNGYPPLFFAFRIPMSFNFSLMLSSFKKLDNESEEPSLSIFYCFLNDILFGFYSISRFWLAADAKSVSLYSC